MMVTKQDSRAQIRLAIVQHGDYREGLEILERDAPEPYFGMKDSVRLMERFLEGTVYRLISVDAPNYRVQREHGELIGLHRPNWPKLSRYPWSWSVWRHVRAFRPTHLLMRTGGLLAYPSLRWAIKHNAPSLVVMAGYVPMPGARGGRITPKLVRLLNHPLVYRAANHRRPATLSTIEAGVDPAKAVAWDWPSQTKPEDSPPRTLDRAGVPDIAFAGMLTDGKGIADLLEAIILLHNRGVPVTLTVCGDGPMRSELEDRAQKLPVGTVRWLGRVGNDEVQERMRRATVVCVPSRADHSEGLPLTLTEALGCRTPVITTDHPAITKLLTDGEGVRIVPSANPKSLADAIQQLTTDESLYARLSETAPQAFGQLDADITFDQLIWDWRKTWEVPHTFETRRP